MDNKNRKMKDLPAKYSKRLIDLNAERTVLGTMLTGVGDFDKAISLLNKECFTKGLHQRLFEAINQLHDHRKPTDAISVMNYLRTKNISVEATDVMDVSMNYTLSGFTNHIEILRYLHAQRTVERIVLDAVDKVGVDNLEDLINSTTKELESVSEFLAGKNESEHIESSITKSLEAVYHRKEQFENGAPIGVPTGIDKFDRIIGGWQKSNLIILAARPAMGKNGCCSSFHQVGRNVRGPGCYVFA